MPVHKKIPRGKFFVENRTNAKGEATIYIRYFLQRYAKRSTGINIPTNAWDEEKCCVKDSYPQAARINLALQNFKCDIDNRLMEYDGELNRTVLNFILNGGDPTHKGDLPDESPTQVVNKNSSFVDYCKKVNDLKYGKKEYGYSMWYNKQKIIEQFETFLIHWRKTPKFALKDLRADVFDEYIQYRFTVLKNTSKEAVNKTLVPLYVAIKQAVLYGIIDTKLAAPIVDNYLETHETEYKPDMEEEVVEHIRYLKPEQIELLILKRIKSC